MDPISSGKYPGRNIDLITTENVVQNMALPPPIIRQFKSIDQSGFPGEIEISTSGKILKEYLIFEGFSGDLIASYDKTISYIIPKRFRLTEIPFNRMGGDVDKNTIIIFDQVTYRPPTISTSGAGTTKLTPLMARDFGYSYMADVWINVKEVEEDDHTKVVGEKNFHAMKIPVMLGSSLCHLRLDKTTDRERLNMGECSKDPLGYFIIDGRERLIIIHENLRYNKIFLRIDKDGLQTADFTCANIRTTSKVILIQTSPGKLINIYLSAFGRTGDKPNNINLFIIYHLFGMVNFDNIVATIVFFVDPKVKTKILPLLMGNILMMSRGLDIKYIIEQLGERGERLLKEVQEITKGDKTIDETQLITTKLTQLVSDSLFIQMDPLNKAEKIYYVSLITSRSQ